MAGTFRAKTFGAGTFRSGTWAGVTAPTSGRTFVANTWAAKTWAAATFRGGKKPPPVGPGMVVVDVVFFGTPPLGTLDTVYFASVLTDAVYFPGG